MKNVGNVGSVVVLGTTKITIPNKNLRNEWKRRPLGVNEEGAGGKWRK